MIKSSPNSSRLYYKNNKWTFLLVNETANFPFLKLQWWLATPVRLQISFKSTLKSNTIADLLAFWLLFQNSWNLATNRSFTCAHLFVFVVFIMKTRFPLSLCMDSAFISKIVWKMSCSRLWWKLLSVGTKALLPLLWMFYVHFKALVKLY